MTRDQIIAEARTWDRVPFLHGHYHKSGCDCLGLLRGVAIALGIDASNGNPKLKHLIGYGRQPDPAKMREGLSIFLDEIPLVEAREGDIVWMRMEQNVAADPQHLGILMPGGYIIHALEREKRVVHHRLDRRWRDRFVSAWRFPGVA